MKELTVEEKAKAYDEAINRMKHYVIDEYGCSRIKVANVFPELAESEDERIRKALIEGFKVMKDNSYEGCTFSNYNIPVTDIIAWLENQGEQSDANKEYWRGYNEGKQCILDKYAEIEKQGQKPTDKVEPKFKEGDWVVDKNGTVQQILSYKNGIYKHTNGYSAKIFEDEWRMWNITKDAKDGDVLYNKDDFAGNSVFIYKGISDKTHTCLYYTRLFRDKDFSIYNDVMLENGVGVNGGEFYPATKEQRDQLEKAMADAGYKWDAEKKELKKIEQNPAWSEEDEEQLSFCCAAIELSNYSSDEYRNHAISFLESLKDRVLPQPKQEWSEEDENILEDIEEAIINYWLGDTQDILLDWLKSLRPQNRWKPSDEQIKALDNARHSNPFNVHVLDTLFHDLKIKGGKL